MNAELPCHIQEAIIDKLDNKGKAKCRIVSKYFNNYIGNITPEHIKHQRMFLNVLKSLIENPKYAFFNLAINSSNFRMIISDENNFEVYVYIITKGLGAKTVTRNYKKINVLSISKIILEKEQYMVLTTFHLINYLKIFLAI